EKARQLRLEGGPAGIHAHRARNLGEAALLDRVHEEGRVALPAFGHEIEPPPRQHVALEPEGACRGGILAGKVVEQPGVDAVAGQERLHLRDWQLHGSTVSRVTTTCFAGIWVCFLPSISPAALVMASPSLSTRAVMMTLPANWVPGTIAFEPSIEKGIGK